MVFVSVGEGAPANGPGELGRYTPHSSSPSTALLSHDANGTQQESLADGTTPGTPAAGSHDGATPGTTATGSHDEATPGTPAAGSHDGETPGIPAAGSHDGETPGTPTAGSHDGVTPGTTAAGSQVCWSSLDFSRHSFLVFKDVKPPVLRTGNRLTPIIQYGGSPGKLLTENVSVVAVSIFIVASSGTLSYFQSRKQRE
jgi:hypothetical protein